MLIGIWHTSYNAHKDRTRRLQELPQKRIPFVDSMAKGQGNYAYGTKAPTSW